MADNTADSSKTAAAAKPAKSTKSATPATPVADKAIDKLTAARRKNLDLAISHIQRLLRHPYYMGIVRYRGVLYPGKHEPLVTPETWQKGSTS